MYYNSLFNAICKEKSQIVIYLHPDYDSCKMKMSIFIAALLSAAFAKADDVQLTVQTVNMPDVTLGVFTTGNDGSDMKAVDATHFTMTLTPDATKKPDVRNLSWVGKDASGQPYQMYVPICLKQGQKTLSLTITQQGEGDWTISTPDRDNQALATYSLLQTAEMHNMMDANTLAWRVKRYQHLADSLGKQAGSDVAAYMRLSAYVTAQTTATTVMMQQRGNPDWHMPAEVSALLAEPQKYLDCEMALSFYVVPHLVAQNLKTKGAANKMRLLFETYKTEALRQRVGQLIANTFVTQYDYSRGFEAGRATLDTLMSYIGKSDELVRNFEKRRFSARGAEMPDDELVAADGSVHHLSELKGKYVYVDFWASWCGPCKQQIPYLKELEKRTLAERNDIVFVSISIDTKEDAWQKALVANDLHGLQWRAKDTQIADRLNISGIPHFVIYGPDGKLFNPSAKRPSQIEKFDF